MCYIEERFIECIDSLDPIIFVFYGSYFDTCFNFYNFYILVKFSSNQSANVGMFYILFRFFSNIVKKSIRQKIVFRGKSIGLLKKRRSTEIRFDEDVQK